MSRKSDKDAGGGAERRVLALLGGRLARERLRRNWTQAGLAEEAGVSRATIARLEAGESTQLANLVRVLRALDLLEGLDALAPEPEVRPMELVERKGRRRRRASPTPRDAGRPAERPRGSAWTWGEDA